MHKYDINVFQLKTFTIAPPAAGADFGIPAISGIRMELLGVKFIFDASAAGGNRLIHMHHLEGVNHTQGTTANGFITANETITVELSQAMENQDLTASFNTITMPLPLNIFIQTGEEYVSAILNISALDQISDIDYRVKIWHTL